MASFFRFRLGRATGLGTGAEAYALLPPETKPPVDGFLVPRYSVKRSLNAVAGGNVMLLPQGLTAIDLRGNGAAYSGGFRLQPLSRVSNDGGN